MALQRGVQTRISQLQNDLDAACRQLPVAEEGVERCAQDIADAEQQLDFVRQLAADAVARRDGLTATIDSHTAEIERLTAYEAEQVELDKRRLAEANLAQARAAVEAATAELADFETTSATA